MYPHEVTLEGLRAVVVTVAVVSVDWRLARDGLLFITPTGSDSIWQLSLTSLLSPSHGMTEALGRAPSTSHWVYHGLED